MSAVFTRFALRWQTHVPAQGIPVLLDAADKGDALMTETGQIPDNFLHHGGGIVGNGWKIIGGRHTADQNHRHVLAQVPQGGKHLHVMIGRQVLDADDQPVQPALRQHGGGIVLPGISGRKRNKGRLVGYIQEIPRRRYVVLPA